MFQAIGQFIVSIALGAAALLGYHQSVLGGAVYAPVPRYESSLALALTSTQTSTMNLVSGVDGNGMTLSGPTCFTLDSGVANSVEDVCGTASGTVVSSLTRGVDSSGYNGSSTLAHAHRVGADVKITDSPYLAQISSLLNGSSSLPNPLTYSSSISTSTIAATGTNLVDVALLNSTAFSGAPNGSLTVKGIYQEATQAQMAAGTAAGSTGADLVTANKYSSLTASTSPVSVIASGTIDPSFVSGTAYTFTSSTLNGATTISGSVTNNASNIFSQFPTIATTSPTSSLQLAPKGYVDFFLGSAVGTSTQYSASAGTGASSSTVSTTVSFAKNQGGIVMWSCGATWTTSAGAANINMDGADIYDARATIGSYSFTSNAIVAASSSAVNHSFNATITSGSGGGSTANISCSPTVLLFKAQ